MTQENYFSDLYDVEEESLFARDLDGQLIRDRKATLDEYDRVVDVTFVLDPDNLVTVQVPKAVPTIDSQGVYLQDKDGSTIPRSTTIYDALVRGREDDRTAEELNDWETIPTLCHQEHMNPVGVCRVCSVFIQRRLRDGTIRPARRLVPACQHRVEAGMIVHTGDSSTQYGERVRTSVRMLTQLLVARNYHPEPEQGLGVSRSLTPTIGTYHNELLALAEQTDLTQISAVVKAAPPDPSRIDDSSDVILVDLNNCILCNRCVRACCDVQPFNIIGRTGKGLDAAIGFDLNDPMGDSGCVACGECMISYPTGALTFKKPVTREYWTDEKEEPDAEPMLAEELCGIELFRGIPLSFLKWNDGAVLRRVLHDGQILCREGDYGATAYVIEAGKLDILVDGTYETTRTPDDIIVGRSRTAHLFVRGT